MKWTDQIEHQEWIKPISQTLNYRIRPAGFGDIEGMISLLQILFSIEADFSFDREKQQRGLAMMLTDCSNRCIMVAEAEGRVVGMCTVQILISTAEGGLSALIEDLIVAEGCRGQGIGKELLRAITSWAKNLGVRRLQLLADRNNAGGLEFYQKQVWQITELICLRTYV
jgi:GNAT superfamily N-acetyltransferase